MAGAGAGRSRVHQGLEERWQERCRVRGARGLRSPSPGMQARIGSYGREGVGWGAGLGQRPALCRMPHAACRMPRALAASHCNLSHTSPALAPCMATQASFLSAEQQRLLDRYAPSSLQVVMCVCVAEGASVRGV